MKYKLHKKFIKSYRKLSLDLQKSVKMKLILFCEDPYSKQLNNHSLSGKLNDYRCINITGDIRAIYKKNGDNEVVFVLIGTHSKLYG